MSEPTNPNQNLGSSSADDSSTPVDLNKDRTPETGPVHIPAVPPVPPVPPTVTHQSQIPQQGHNDYGQAPGYLPATPMNDPYLHQSAQGTVQTDSWEKYNSRSTYFGMGAVASLILGFFLFFPFILTPIFAVLAIVYARLDKVKGIDTTLGLVLGWISVVLFLIPVVFLGLLLIGIVALA